MQKQNKKYLIFKWLFALFYLIVVAVTYHFGVSCFFRTVIGIPCPGCGITRAGVSLLHGDVNAAVHYNFMIFSIPLLVAYFITDGRLFGKKADRVVMAVIMAGFLVSWIIKLV